MFCESAGLLQIVIEIVCDLVHEVDPPYSENIVLEARVWEIVQLEILL